MKTYRCILTIKIPPESPLYAMEPETVVKAIRDDLCEPGLPETVELELKSVKAGKKHEQQS